MKLIEGINVMIDLETCDTVATAAIRSIGAVKFDSNGIIDSFYQNVFPESCYSLGMTQSQDTMTWWESQGDSAKNILEKDQVTIQEALKRFNTWYGPIGLYTWGNGANFDNPIMEYAYRITNIKCPWEFWKDRCFRTARSVVFIKRDFVGIKHYALDDAQNQALLLIDMNRKLVTATK
jgi:DNA polymerase III epsilon subunit-like protein